MATAIYSSSSVENGSPNKINVIVSQALDSSIDVTGFTVSINAGGNVVSSLIVVQGSTQITITISQDIIDTDSVTVAYAGGGAIVSETGGEGLTIFTAQAITNNVYPDLADADPTLLTGVVASDGIDIIYDSGDTYTTITTTHLKTPSILRQALNDSGLQLDGDRPGAWSIIKAARDSIQASL